MRNLDLLNKKCSGWKPSNVITYIKTCEHLSHVEKEFAGILSNALEIIAETATLGKKVFLYHFPKKTWAPETAEAYAQAEQIFAKNFGEDIRVSIKMFKPEDNYIYFLIEAEQMGEEVQLLFLEEMR